MQHICHEFDKCKVFMLRDGPRSLLNIQCYTFEVRGSGEPVAGAACKPSENTVDEEAMASEKGS